MGDRGVLSQMTPNVNLHLVNFLLKLFYYHLTKCYLHRNHNFKYTEWRQNIQVVYNTLIVKAMANFILSSSSGMPQF